MDVHLCIYLAWVGTLKHWKKWINVVHCEQPCWILADKFIGYILGSLSLSWRNLTVSGDHWRKRIIWGVPTFSDPTPCPGKLPSSLETLILNKQREDLAFEFWNPGLYGTGCRDWYHSCHLITIFRKWANRLLILREDSSLSTVLTSVLSLGNKLGKDVASSPIP